MYIDGGGGKGHSAGLCKTKYLLLTLLFACLAALLEFAYLVEYTYPGQVRYIHYWRKCKMWSNDHHHTYAIMHSLLERVLGAVVG